jgi:hypothetical protein
MSRRTASAVQAPWQASLFIFSAWCAFFIPSPYCLSNG